MDSAYLLVVDKTPDNAQKINSFLRNEGLAVTVLNAPDLRESEAVIAEQTPFLILISTPLPESVKVSQLMLLADQYSIPLALQVNPEDLKPIGAAIATHPLLVINNNENDQLLHIVKQHLSSGQISHEYENLAYKFDELQNRYDLLLNSTTDSIAYIHEGLHLYANRAYLELLHLNTLEDITGLSLLEFMTPNDGTNLKKLLRDMSHSVCPKEALEVTIQLPGRGGFTADLKFSPARFNTEQCIQMLVREKNSSSTLIEELDRLRKTDPLTRMINRQTFAANLAGWVEEDRRNECESAILYIETDGMERLQRGLTMESIDSCTLDLANIISACLEPSDISARFSDNGFIVLVRRDEKSKLQQTGDRILENYASHIIDLGDRTLTTSCSIGMANVGPFTDATENVIEQARTAFYQASREGNTLVRFKPELTTVEPSEAERDWVERIHYALHNHDFYTIQQPIVDLEGENDGLFATTTFMREERGDTQASEFRAEAEQNNLGSAIDRHIIPQLMLAIAGTGDRHIISLSLNSILDFSFPNWFQRMLNQTGVAASQMVIEISAEVADSHLLPTHRLVDEMQKMGCGIILSEFDHERRTIQLLDHLPVNMIKLRIDLTKGLSSNTTNQGVIRDIVKAVETRAISIVADEVQDTTDLASLWQCGIRLVTGDFLNEAPQVVGQ